MYCRSVSTIFSGCDCTISLDGDGNLHSFGYSSISTHGHEDSRIFPPKMISTLKDIKSISCYKNTICLDNDGNVFTFGHNFFGELGIGIDRSSLSHTSIHLEEIVLENLV